MTRLSYAINLVLTHLYEARMKTSIDQWVSGIRTTYEQTQPLLQGLSELSGVHTVHVSDLWPGNMIMVRVSPCAGLDMDKSRRERSWYIYTHILRRLSCLLRGCL